MLKVLNLFSDPKLEKLLHETKHKMKKKDFDDGIKKIDKKIESEPENIDLLFLKSLALSISNRHQEAIRFLKKEFKDHPNRKDEELFTLINYVLVYNHLTLAEFDKALKISEKMSDFYPDL